MSSAHILTVMKEGQTLQTCPVEGDVLLGRAQDCLIALDDRAISRQHAIFRKVGAQVQVEKKSEFGSLLVNGAECSLAVLKEGDLISIGPYLIRLSLSQAQNAPSSPLVPVQASSSQAPPKLDPAPVAEESPQLVADGALSLPPAQDFSLMADLAVPQADSPMQDGVDQPQGLNEEPAAVLGIENSDQPVENDMVLADPASPDLESEPKLDSAPSSDEGAIDLGGQIDFDSPVQESPSNSQIIEVQIPEASEMIGDDAKTKITPSTKLSVKLIFPEGKANVTEYEIKGDEVLIGRGKDCDIILNDKKSSRENSLIRRAGARFIIKDLESSNGTYVNGEKVSEKELAGDDVIRIGAVEFRFKAVSVEYLANEGAFMSLPEESASPELDAAAAMGNLAPQDSLMPPSNPSGFDGPVALEGQSGQPILPGLATPGMNGPLPGMGPGGTPDIAGISGGSAKKGTLLEKFRALPKRTQYIGIVAVVLFLWWVMEDDEPAKVVKKNNAPKKAVTAPTGEKGPLTFESLSPEQKRFVEAQHNLAFDYYKNKEYDKAIFEVEKIFALIPDYKDSREIQRYARAGKQKLDAIEEERKKKEEEAALKKKIAQLVDETKERMDKKQYEQAKELFSQILALDPDNAQVTAWRKDVEAYEEQVRLEQQQKQVQIDINKHAWNIFNEAMALKKAGKYHSAISTFQSVIDVGASDKKLLPLTKTMIAACRSTIQRLREPVLKQAQEAENAGEFAKAFQLYKKATRIDPPHPAGYAGMSRIRGVLHEKAKAIYTEAILAESFSDFVNAKKLFKECAATAPEDDIYHERAVRKLAHYFRKDEAPSQ